jgi:bifunctional DNase/RNase
LALGNGIAFDIDFLFWDELRGQPPWGHCHIELLEAGGHRRLGFAIGLFECVALDRLLQGYSSPRPLTHHAMATAITALRGTLEYVEIDECYPAELTYDAKLHIHQMGVKVVVDVRPSDALVLALICDVPIIVSQDVLAAL